MEIRSPLASKGRDTASLLLSDRKRSDLFLFLSLFSGMLCLVFLLVAGGISIGFGLILAIPVILLIVALIVRWPMFGFYLIAVSALAIDSDPVVVKSITINFYLYYWPTGLTGFIDRPIGLLMLFILLVSICHNLLKRQGVLHGGKLLLPFLFFMLCVAYGVAYGLATHGDFKIIVLEIRPFEYLFLSYLLAYNLIRHRDQIRHFFWLVIVCAGVRTLYGLFIVVFVFHGHLAAQHGILPHEESFFFVALILLVILFSLHYRYRPQFYAALCILPFLLVVLVANNRRADYLAFLVGAAVALFLVFVVKPHTRKRLIAILVVCAILGGGYVALFSNMSGAFAEPARGIVSIFKPDPSSSDYLSNLYRTNEIIDLKYTVMQSPLIGYGFGKQFLQPIPLGDLGAGNVDLNGNPFQYIPHNNIYWIWMRLGAIGYFAFWFLIGAVIVRGCQIMRRLKDPYLQLVSIYIIGVIFIEIMVAYADYQLYIFRNVIYVGLLFGILMKLPALDTKEVNPTDG